METANGDIERQNHGNSYKDAGRNEPLAAAKSPQEDEKHRKHGDEADCQQSKLD